MSSAPRVRRIGPLVVAGALLMLATAASAQTCMWVPRSIADEAVRFLRPGTPTQSFCAPCRDARAVKRIVEETEIRQTDAYNHQVLVNGQPLDLAYLYLFDPRRKAWRNLGLALRCHEEDDVPPTLPANRVAH